MENSSNSVKSITYLNKTEFEQFPPKLRERIVNVILKEEYITCEVSNRKTSSGGANYLGDLYEVDVHGETTEGSKETHLFIKQNVSKNAAEGYICVSNVHSCEVFFYQDLCKIFTELQEKANVPLNERFNVVRSYDASLEAIILENVALQGFKIPNRMECFPLKFAELAVQQLAKLHGLSFAVRKEKPEYCEAKLKVRKLPLKWNEEFVMNANNLVNITMANVDDDSKKMIESCKNVVLENFGKYLGLLPYEETSISCLCHGDYRNGNILMQQIGGEVTKIIPVDYQSLLWGNPVIDLLYLMYTGSDSRFRKEHMQDLKDMYYRSLQEFLQYFDIDLEQIYPKIEFEREFKEKLNFGLGTLIMWGPIMFVPEQDAPDLGQVKMYELNFTPDARFAERVMETLKEFKEYGYFSI